MKKKISERQQKIYEFIRTTLIEKSIPPSMREIGKTFGIRSTNGVEGHLSALERNGLIVRKRGTSRGITLSETTNMPVAIPLLGRVAAGHPVFSPENRDGDVMVDLEFFSVKKPHTLFALHVRGESMVNAHILPGDTILVRMQSSAENGDIVVALVDGEATVKRFFQEKKGIRLQPENNTMSPLFVKDGDFRILGKVVGAMRRLT
ncbi:MAG: transcriptional repressor LexA [Nitrospirota bacterium]